LTFLAQSGQQANAYGAVADDVVARFRSGEWISFSVQRSPPQPHAIDSLTPVVFVCDDMGSAVARGALLRRQYAAQQGRNWWLSVSSVNNGHPALADSAAWLESQLCRRIDFLRDGNGDISAGMDRVAEPLWRWLIDNSLLYVAIADSETAAIFDGQLARLVMQRAHVDETAARERIDSWQREKQLLRWNSG
jgi:hypothetical protein